MDPLENMIKSIITDADKEISVYLEKEKEALAEELLKKKAEIKADQENQKEQLKGRLDKSFRQLTARNRLNYRENIMSEKMEYLNQVFAEVLSVLNTWSKDEVQTFFISIVDRFPAGKYRVLVGERSKSYLTYDFMKGLSDGKDYTIAENLIAEKGGFILEQADQVQFDYLFNNVITVLKEKYLFKVSEILFK